MRSAIPLNERATLPISSPRLSSARQRGHKPEAVHGVCKLVQRRDDAYREPHAEQGNEQDGNQK